jgi:hypothetical protein
LEVRLKNRAWCLLVSLFSFADRVLFLLLLASLLPLNLSAQTVRTITGSPLTIYLNDETSFQVVNNVVGTGGNIYPDNEFTTPSSSVFLRVNGVLYGASSVGVGQAAWTPVSISPVTGSGSSADPFTVTIVVAAGATGVTLTEKVTYVNGENLYRQSYAIANASPASVATDLYLAADLYLAGSDLGIGVLAGSGSVGGANCANQPPGQGAGTYNILFIPLTPATHFVEGDYFDVFTFVDAGDLPDTIETACIDNGAALQWKQTIPAAGSTTINSAVSFGQIPQIVTAFRVDAVNPNAGSAGQTLAVSVSGAGFQPGTTFNFGQGITVNSAFINSATLATVSITIQGAAAPGPRDVTATQPSGPTATLPNGFTVLQRTCPENALILAPAQGATGVPTSGFLQYASRNASQIRVYFGPAGSGCSTLFTTTTGFASYSGLQDATQYEFRIEGFTPGCPVMTSECVRFTTGTTCPPPATLLSPIPGSTISPPVTFRWSSVPRATGYTVFAGVGSEQPREIGTTTTETTLIADLRNGAVNWYVVADVPGCGSLQSTGGLFGSCGVPGAPTPAVVAESTTGQTYDVSWEPVGDSYEVDEATNPAFIDARSTTTSATSVSFTKNVTQPTAFYYRVRAFANCLQTFGSYSDTVRMVVVPVPPRDAPEVSANVPAGSTRPVTVDVFVAGQGQPANFSASVDKDFMSVEPTSGTMPAEGLNFRVTLNPSALPNGAFTGTLIVTFPDAVRSRLARNDTAPPKSSAVSITLATPASPSKTTSAAPDSLIIPGLGHLEGVASFRSDVRIANPTNATAAYELTLTPADRSIQPKSVTIRVAGGATTALDDIVRRWFGLGSLPGESGSGSVQIRPVSTGAPGVRPAPALASSRTFATSGGGTLGQFIPPVPFSKFIARAGAALSLQQISQTAQSRTNLGLVEAAGESATVLLSIFDARGTKLRDISVDLVAREQRSLNSILALQGLAVSNGRIEVRVTGGQGRVTAFASVVDNASGDQFYTPPAVLGEEASTRYVFPGAARLTTPSANWRTDLRIFNGGSTAQRATLAFYPQGGNAATAEIDIGAGEISVLDDVIGTLFGVTGGGAIHVSTANASNLVVTGRTYNLSGSGATGQFIGAVPLERGAQAGGPALNLLQLEDSPRYRSNIGIAEMSGQPATVEVQVFLPEAKTVPVLQIPLLANEFRQFSLRELGLGNVYNVRVAMRVISGSGRITTFGSLIDLRTGDATFLPAQ